MSLDKDADANKFVTVPTEEVQEYLNDLFEQYDQLPRQDEIEFDTFKDHPIWQDLSDAGQGYYQECEEQLPNLGALLTDSSRVGIVFQNLDIPSPQPDVLRKFIAMRYGFWPKVDLFKSLHDQAETELPYNKYDAASKTSSTNVLMEDIDPILNIAIDFKKAHLSEKSEEALNNTGIRTVGDFLMAHNSTLQKQGIRRDIINKLRDHIRSEYNVDKHELRKRPLVVTAMRYKNLVDRIENSQGEE